MKTYHLTSPHMHGPDVAVLQRALNKHKFGPLLTDGDYGPQTAVAVKHAKYALGYPLRKVNTTAGPFLLHLLTSTKRPPGYAVRARIRKRKIAQTETMAARAFALLESKVGTKESPAGSNRCWASLWYGIIGPWCAMSVTWAYVGAGSKAFVKGSRYAYVPFILADATATQNGLSLTHEPRKGDPVLFDWTGDGVPDHVGLFDKWLDRTNGTFQTVEGNTGDTDFSNGGEVMRATRYMTNVRAFVRVSK